MACWNSFERLPIFRRLSRTHKEKIMKKHVYQFGPGGADGDGTMKDVLGGKGAGLAEMCRANLPVPPGFTISTEAGAARLHHLDGSLQHLFREPEHGSG